MTRSRLANVNRIREPSKDQKDHLWGPLRKKNNHQRLVILWRMHLQERFQSLGNGCQRSFLFPSTLSARFSSFRCVYYTTVLYYALSTTADRKSSHKWRRKERERERERRKVGTIEPDHIKNCCSRTPGAACLAEAGPLPTTPIDEFASLYNLHPSSPWPRELFLPVFFFSSLTHSVDAHQKRVQTGCFYFSLSLFSMPTWKEPWFLYGKRLIQTEFITLPCPESRADVFFFSLSYSHFKESLTT
jgi:hypothetical protein